MSGAEVLRQVRADVLCLARDALDGRDPNPESDGIVDVIACRILAALDGCVLLTREEAKRVKDELLALYGYTGPSGPPIGRRETNAALALLTPKEDA